MCVLIHSPPSQHRYLHFLVKSALRSCFYDYRLFAAGPVAFLMIKLLRHLLCFLGVVVISCVFCECVIRVSLPLTLLSAALAGPGPGGGSAARPVAPDFLPACPRFPSWDGSFGDFLSPFRKMARRRRGVSLCHSPHPDRCSVGLLNLESGVVPEESHHTF